MRICSWFLMVMVTSGCFSAKKELPVFERMKVVERMGESDSTPGWASGELTMYQEAGDIHYIETVTMSGNARPEACINAAADLGRVQILRQVQDALTSSGQVAETAVSGDPAVERLMAFLSQGKLSGVKLVARYWERRAESDESGMRVLRIMCASRIAIPRSMLESQLRAATNYAGGGNAAIRRKLLDAQKQFLDSVSAGPGARQDDEPAE